MEKMISIIIATYNSGATLKRALESVISQCYNNWECIVVDGDSSDNTIDIVKSFQLIDKRIRYISEKDNGIYDALNKGVKLSVGEWIYVLGSDDELTKDGLSSLIKNASKDDDVVYGNVFLRSPNGSLSKSISKDVWHLKYIMVCSHQALIIRRKVIEFLGGFNLNYKIRADFDLIQRAYLNGFRFKKVETYVAFFLLDGLSSNSKISTHIERYHICKNNKSSRMPFLWYIYQESKFLIKYCLNRLL